MAGMRKWRGLFPLAVLVLALPSLVLLSTHHLLPEVGRSSLETHHHRKLGVGDDATAADGGAVAAAASSGEAQGVGGSSMRRSGLERRQGSTDGSLIARGRSLLPPAKPPRPSEAFPPPPPLPPPPPPPVEDLPPGSYAFLRPNCGDWHAACPTCKQKGECRTNPGHMYLNCQLSCGVCNVTYLHHDQVQQHVEIAKGVLMPRVGFGTAGLGDYTGDVSLAAIKAGYRLLDGAEAREWYREDLLGQAWPKSGIKREHIFLTSKVHPRNLGYWSTLQVVQQSLKDLRTKHIDLMLLHYPECWGNLCGSKKPEGTWQDSWAALEELVQEGSLRAIGVSNFNVGQLDQLLRVAKVKPALVQSNSDLLRADAPVQAFCRRHGITFQGYSTLGGQWLVQTQGGNPVVQNPVVAEIAARHGKGPGQVVLRWALQHGQAVIPRTTKQKRLEQNLDVFSFDLSDAEMQQLDALDGTEPQT